jgi:hypothetical protein
MRLPTILTNIKNVDRKFVNKTFKKTVEFDKFHSATLNSSYNRLQFNMKSIWNQLELST